MNLSYMMAGNANNFIEIESSASPSQCSEYSLSINKSVVLDESSPPSSANKCERGPITPRKLMLTPLSKGQFDIMSLFAKKPAISIDVASSEEKAKGKQIMEKKCDDIGKEINAINEFVKAQIEKSKESLNDREMEIFELKSYFIKQMKELQERNQQLLNENIMLKEIQYELDKSAEKIAVFRTESKSLNICSYLYDSWRNRESKVDLYKKYMEKVQQYDDLLKKYQLLETQYYDALSNKLNKTRDTSNNQGDQIKKKRGRKPKNNQLDHSIIDVENENSCEILTKKVLKSIDAQGKNIENSYSTNINSKNLGTQNIIDDNKSEVSVRILKEKKDYTNKKISELSNNVTPVKGQNRKDNTSINLTNNKKQNKEIVLLDSDKSAISNRSELIKKSSMKDTSQNVQPKKPQNKQYNDLSRKNSLQINTQTDDQDFDDFDDNRSTISTMTNNGSKREIRKKKIISKEKKKYNQEAQDLAFNSIADTLFSF